MHVIRSLLVTVALVGLGIALATVSVEGRTPWEHLQRAYHHHAAVALPPMGKLKNRVQDAFEDAKDTLSRSSTSPHEHHSNDDRAALNKVIAHRSTSERTL